MAKFKGVKISKMSDKGFKTAQWTANGITYRIQKFKGEKNAHFFTSKGVATKFEGTIPASKAKLLMRFASKPGKPRGK